MYVDECDNNEITFIISLANDDEYFLNDLDSALYSIKDIFQKKNISVAQMLSTNGSIITGKSSSMRILSMLYTTSSEQNPSWERTNLMTNNTNLT